MDRTKTLIRAVWITDFRHQLVDHGASETKRGGQPTQVLLDLNKQRSSRFNDWDLGESKQKIMNLQSVPRLQPMYRHKTLWMKRSLDPLEEASASPPKCIFLTFLPSLPQRNLWYLPGWLDWGRGNNYAFQWWFEISSELTLLKTSNIAAVHQPEIGWLAMFWLISIPLCTYWAPEPTTWSLRFLFWNAELPYMYWVTRIISTWVMQPTEQGLLW